MTGSESSGGGWTFGRILGFVVGLVGMTGFGFCSIFGLVVAGGDHGLQSIVLMFALPGLLIAFLCFLLVLSMARRARKPPPP